MTSGSITYRRGLLRCLSFLDRQCEGLNRGISNRYSFPRLFLFITLLEGTKCTNIFIMNISEFMEEAIPEFKKEFTDLFFCFVQSDKKLMKSYLDTVASIGDLKTTNSHIAQLLSREFSLEKAEEECNMPKSCLIQSYSQLK